MSEVKIYPVPETLKQKAHIDLLRIQMISGRNRPKNLLPGIRNGTRFRNGIIKILILSGSLMGN